MVGGDYRRWWEETIAGGGRRLSQGTGGDYRRWWEETIEGGGRRLPRTGGERRQCKNFNELICKTEVKNHFEKQGLLS